MTLCGETDLADERSDKMQKSLEVPADDIRNSTRSPREWSFLGLSFGRAESLLLLIFAVLASGALAFAAISDMTDEEEGRAFDTGVLQFFHPHADPADPIGPQWLDHAMYDVTALGSIAVLGLITLIAGGFLVMRSQLVKGAALAGGLIGGIFLSETLKAVFERTRPPEAYRAAEALNHSFPSGHALLSTVVYLTLGVMLARSVSRKRLRAYILGVAMLLALLVGVSRVYLGVHWATDVLAGWCVGAMWAAVCWIAANATEQTLIKTRDDI